MKFCFVLLLILGFVTSLQPAMLFAQRDAPVWDSHLARTSVYKSDKHSLDVDLVYQKSGGPHEHTEHQLNLYSCLDSDVAAIMKIAESKNLLDKKSKGKQLIDVLLETKLLIKLESKVAKKSTAKVGINDLAPELVGPGAFQYKFKFTNAQLFEAVEKLPSFDKKDTRKTGSYESFNDKFRLIAFVPVNDSKYSTEVSVEIRKSADFAHLMDTQTPILYFKPLTQRFQFNRIPSGEILLYID